MLQVHEESIHRHHFRMLPVSGGSFDMGSEAEDEAADPDEKPRHQVLIADFRLGEFPVTQMLWRLVAAEAPDRLTTNPSSFEGDLLPVDNVSWNDIQVFLEILNHLTRNSRPPKTSYRLPSEAEWEYAARGGVFHRDGYVYAGSDRLEDLGWFAENNGLESRPVGLKAPNQLGLFDMSGNIREWCADDWHKNYEGAPDRGIAWEDYPRRGAFRVNRGGSWGNTAQLCRAAFRYNWLPDTRGDYLGFRLCLSLSSGGSPLPAFL